MCGLRPRAGLRLDGLDQSGTLQGQPSPRDLVFCHFPHGSANQAANIPGFLPGTYVRRGDWKLVQYVDAHGVEEDQWELYCLVSDPLEILNLVDYRTGIVRSDVSVPGMTPEELAAKNEELRNLLFRATGVTEPPVLPAGITLYQNIPNPFRQHTEISFYLPESCLATLTLTSLTGKEVMVMVNRKLLSGFHTVDLDATSLPPGVYLVKLSAGSRQAVRKMILVR